MIYIINPPDKTVRPALIVSSNLAFPIYDEPWGASYPITNWRKAGLTRPSNIVMSQPLTRFKVRRRIGTLDVEDRHRFRRAVTLFRPALRAEMTVL